MKNDLKMHRKLGKIEVWRGVWELLGATLGRKLEKDLSWSILADFGRPREAQNDPSWRQVGPPGAPLERTWAPSCGQDGAQLANLAPKMANLRAFWKHLGSLSEHLKNL